MMLLEVLIPTLASCLRLANKCFIMLSWRTKLAHVSGALTTDAAIVLFQMMWLTMAVLFSWTMKLLGGGGNLLNFRDINLIWMGWLSF